MTSTRAIGLAAGIALLALGACGSTGTQTTSVPVSNASGDVYVPGGRTEGSTYAEESTVWEIFSQRDDGTKVAVNRYLWNASLEVLDFLPVKEVDPFTGVIVTDYGTPPGGGRSYRATVYISDPALEARSLNVALQTSGGRAADAGTQRAVEDAILTRARQLRVADRGR
ncbi:DUF3576 domain-containing protein [Pseudooceanicola algae]|uniref:DUF3576 domain-containing protein n=1 Tax=Pseudooceanicola algae TaxID=1537215 RepID=A0A418SFZ9_9RHOB|nr:DUF3576 domain-containing protein [Pseudooceanicola algae]QPM91600.1 hypothetical protein PSAL_028550 [Pseudooceanicola algae]